MALRKASQISASVIAGESSIDPKLVAVSFGSDSFRMDPSLMADEPPLSPRVRRALLWGLLPVVAAVSNAVAAASSVRARRPDARWLAGLAALDFLAAIAVVSLAVSMSARAVPAPSPRERQSVGLRVSEVDGGARVDGLVLGGPAETAGVRVGDVIDEVDGESVTSVEALGAAIQKPGPR